ncbi:hypothetical protein [Shewanella violacea]|uniref:Uncharacterized protein n=1 Tax=Shewanella violacea (strain JCM 10179 / CIP 106290 / LMG 19151 / DSS12) TaxID=637905 RepID=D4ZL21_SHEVD|nr:hypothetical protein SVI_2399 [Shewanella violacea DSS12]
MKFTQGIRQKAPWELKDSDVTPESVFNDRTRTYGLMLEEE